MSLINEVGYDVKTKIKGVNDMTVMKWILIKKKIKTTYLMIMTWIKYILF